MTIQSSYLRIYTIVLNNSTMTATQTKLLYLPNTSVHYSWGYLSISNQKIFITSIKTTGSGNLKDVTLANVYIVNLEDVISSDNNSTLTAVQTIPINSLINYYTYENGIYDNKIQETYMVGNETDTRIQFVSTWRETVIMFTLTNSLDSENLIAIKYKNQYFTRIEPQLLSAGQSDVRTGKTFIGWQGYPETGTMEVE